MSWPGPTYVIDDGVVLMNNADSVDEPFDCWLVVLLVVAAELILEQPPKSAMQFPVYINAEMHHMTVVDIPSNMKRLVWFGVTNNELKVSTADVQRRLDQWPHPMPLPSPWFLSPAIRDLCPSLLGYCLFRLLVSSFRCDRSDCKVSHGSMSIVAEEAKAIAAAAAKAADEAATKAASGGVAETPAGDGGKQGKTSAKGAAFNETRDDWGYWTANVAVVERYLRLFASAQSFELRVLWMLLVLEGMKLARVSFHRFDEFKGAMRELYERERLERWTVDVGRIELCNDETLLKYLVAFVWTLIGQGSGRHGQLPLTAGRLANSLSNFARVRRQKHGRLDARSVARIDARVNMRREPELARLAQRTVDPSLYIAIPRSRSRGRSAAGFGRDWVSERRQAR
ncbi:hypothetical protein AaE_003937 [Aphanomyces astaci]|uniref:Uncharacterized protein n=1 Tax=Aphanomyces astaci TaxID=112090 RepID=A0A6A5ASM2_APHAT|nr:hypothetical protein AaE_003937 [Aphanomyces astaci]